MDRQKAYRRNSALLPLLIGENKGWLETRLIVAKTYYEILGVPRNASELEIKSAYHRLARKYHPDKAGEQVDVAAMEAEFSQISTAYNMLKDREKRTSYDQNLEQKRQQGGGQSGSAPGDGIATPSSDHHLFGPSSNDKNKLAVAKRAYIKGTQLMAAGDYAKASEFFDVAIKNNDEEPVYHARLAVSLLRSHRSFTRATEAAQRAIALDPYNSDYRLILAELYENAKILTMAVTTYEEILKWDPANEKARMALEVLAPKKSNLFSKLFGKKQ